MNGFFIWNFSIQILNGGSFGIALGCKEYICALKWGWTYERYCYSGGESLCKYKFVFAIFFKIKSHVSSFEEDVNVSVLMPRRGAKNPIRDVSDHISTGSDSTSLQPTKYEGEVPLKLLYSIFSQSSRRCFMDHEVQHLLASRTRTYLFTDDDKMFVWMRIVYSTQILCDEPNLTWPNIT